MSLEKREGVPYNTFAKELIKEIDTMLKENTSIVRAQPEEWWQAVLLFISVGDGPLSQWAGKEVIELLKQLPADEAV